MTVRWITPLLGTADASHRDPAEGTEIVDVRDMVDKAGNRASHVLQKIDEACAYLGAGRRVVICCDYGISRSNAVAAGVLARFERIRLDDAIRRVRDATGEREIKLEPLAAVRAALGESSRSKPQAGTVLVTGASGFVGRAVCAALASRFHLIAPSRADVDLGAGSTDLDLFAGGHAASAIVHLANPRVFTSNAALGQTLTILRNVIDVCAVRELPLLYLSGWEIYSGYEGDVRADEALAPRPRGPYGETKLLAETLIEHCRSTRGLRCALLRSGPVYGPGGDKPRFIYNFLDKARRNAPIVTHRYRNGDPALDLMHVDDLAGAVSAALQRNFSGTLNLGTGVTTTTRRVAELLKLQLGSTSPIEACPIDTDTARVAMDASLAARVLGWHPAVSLEQGVAQLVGDQRGVAKEPT